MAGDQHKPDKAAQDGAAPPTSAEAGVGESASPPPSWGNLWQLPTILISASLIGLGLYRAMSPKPANDFAGALNQVEHFLQDGELGPAEVQLRSVIEPNLAAASREQQAHFHALTGDFLFVSQFKDERLPDSAGRPIIEQYAKAAELGRPATPIQLERWAEAHLALGELDGARARLVDLDRLSESPGTAAHAEAAHPAGTALDTGHVPGAKETEVKGGHDGHDPTSSAKEDAHASRNRLFRRLVEYSMHQPGIPQDELMRMLSEYRGQNSLAPMDEIWAVARQAEMRLVAGQAQTAVDILLVDMRRMENKEGPETKAGFGELYTLLGRGYFDLGDTAKAESHLEHALKLFEGPEPPRGDALVMLGQIAMARTQPEAAFEKFHMVVRDFIGTASFLPGLLGRAEVQSILGDHEASLNDYRELRDMLPKAGKRRDVNPERVAASLCDRHDAVLALGRLDLAQEYVGIAEGMFSFDRVPLDVLIRLGSVHRQQADNLIAAAMGGAALEPLAGDVPDIDAGVRHEANMHYEKAGDFYVRHATAESEAPLSEQQWADSMWMAGDCYDLGGRQDLAVQQFRKYLDSRPNEDPRRAETMYRIAQAEQAVLEHEKAIATYELILSEQPRSAFAAKSHVPLARCYLAVNRRPDAQQELQRVLTGEGLLTPDARDYRDALIELGRIDHDGKEFAPAIEALNQALERYPDDPRRMEILYLLADSYRGNAMQLAETTAKDAMLSTAETDRLGSLQTTHLQMAQELFGKVCDAYGTGSVSLNAFQKDLLRRADFYRADCAFYLRQYEQAIQYYDRASRTYSGHQSSLYALIQIVNSYSALGDFERAAAAHHRALLRLRQLPEAAFAQPDGMMDRAAWERWLDNTPVAPAPTAAASASSG